MAEPFRVAFSGDFFRHDGRACFPDADWHALEDDPRVEIVRLDMGPEITPDQIETVDALMLLLPRVAPASFHPNRRLSVIARFGVGYDTLDLAACTANDCALVIGPDGVRRPVAVSIITLMLALTMRLRDKDRIAREGPEGWARKTDYNGLGLTGRTLGSIGLGNIGGEMFRLAAPFGLRFIAHDPEAAPERFAVLGVESVDLDSLFRQADVLAVNCPLSEATRGLVNAQRLALMKPSAYLINTARGPIVDQAALTEALRAGRIAGAGLDVLEQEPPAPDEPLLALDNVIVTPHALCFTDELFRGLAAADSAAAMAVMAGAEPVNVVNREVLVRPGFQAKLAAYKACFGD